MERDRKFDNKTITGAALVALGLLVLLGGMGFSGLVGRFMGALLFAGLAYFVYLEGRRKGNGVLQLAALPLAGLALASLLAGFGGGALFLAAVGLAFAFAWRQNPERWWAVIVAGVLGSTAIAAALPRAIGGVKDTLFLLGMAATFFALTRLRVKPQPWAIYPAAALGVLALLGLAGGRSGWLVPTLLIGGGLYLLLQRGRFSKPGAQAAPTPPTTGPVASVAPTQPVDATAPAPAAPPLTSAPLVHLEDENAPLDGPAAEGGAPMPDPNKGPS
ncbi:MAG TPA: hypothetical protein PLT07_05380 [Trueperaceae bacterium]|nr:hypothetical protein [Trueperaceae bacterium]